MGQEWSGEPPLPLQLGVDPSWKLPGCGMVQGGLCQTPALSQIPSSQPSALGMALMPSPPGCPHFATGDPNPLPRGNSVRAGMREPRHIPPSSPVL